MMRWVFMLFFQHQINCDLECVWILNNTGSAVGLIVDGYMYCTYRHFLCVIFTNLWMSDGECIHPHPPAAPLVFNGVVEQDAEDGVHHLGDLLLLAALRVNVAEGQHPVLPHRALQQAPSTGGGEPSSAHTHTQSYIYVCMYVYLCMYVCMSVPMYLHMNVSAVFSALIYWDIYLLFSLLLLNSLIMSERKMRRTSMLSGPGGECFSSAAITFKISVTTTTTTTTAHIMSERQQLLRTLKSYCAAPALT